MKKKINQIMNKKPEARRVDFKTKILQAVILQAILISKKKQ